MPKNKYHKKANTTTNSKLHQKKKDNPGMVIRRCIGSAAFFGSAWFLQWGIGDMSIGNGMSPWLIGIGIALLLWAVIANQDVWKYVFGRLNIVFRWGIIIALSLVSILAPGFGLQEQLNSAREQLLYKAVYYGQIVAGNEPTPIPLPDYAPSDTITVMLGKSRVLMNQYQTAIIQKNDVPVIGIMQKDDGTITINANIYDAKGNNIVSITDGVFNVNPNIRNMIPKQENSHSFSVEDYRGNIIFYLDLLNNKTIRLIGKFYIQGVAKPFVVVPNGEMKWGNVTVLTNGTTFNMTQSNIPFFLKVDNLGNYHIGGN